MNEQIIVGTSQRIRVNEVLFWDYKVLETYDKLAFCTVTDREGHAVGHEICRIVNFEGKELLQCSTSGHLVRQAGESIIPLTRSEAKKAWTDKVANIEKLKQQEAEAKQREEEKQQRFSERAMKASNFQTARYELRGKLKKILATSTEEEILANKEVKKLIAEIQIYDTLIANI